MVVFDPSCPVCGGANFVDRAGELADCERCTPRDRPYECWRCRGHGRLSTSIESGETCPRCEGYGFKNRGDCVACLGCGQGAALRAAERPTCAACRGTGWANEPRPQAIPPPSRLWVLREMCSRCVGRGVWASGCDGLVECHECGGTGYLGFGDCNGCRGTGYAQLPKEDRPYPCEACHGTGGRYVRT